jgi:vitamin B12 transporter
MSYKGSSNLNDKITYVVGSDFIQDKTPTTNHENDIFGIFGEIIHQTSPQLNNNIAVRNDGHSAFGEQFSYRISSAYKLNKNANFKGSYGTGFRSPSLYELYDSNYGNADLKPEKSSNFDLEYTNILSDNLKFTVAYFSNETENIIDWVANPPGGIVGKYEQTSEKKKRKGIEITNVYNMNESTTIDFSYSYTADDKGGKVIRVPRNQLGLNLGNQYNDKLYFNGSIKYNTDIIDSGNVELDDYSLVNLLAKYELYENTNLKLRIENIFNNSYQVIDKFGTSPRAFYLSIDNAF